MILFCFTDDGFIKNQWETTCVLIATGMVVGTGNFGRNFCNKNYEQSNTNLENSIHGFILRIGSFRWVMGKNLKIMQIRWCFNDISKTRHAHYLNAR